jgi:homoserine acetyltransferase
MDSHNIARGRFDTLEKALKEIHQPMLVIGIDSDILCPVPEQNFWQNIFQTLLSILFLLIMVMMDFW